MKQTIIRKMEEIERCQQDERKDKSQLEAIISEIREQFLETTEPTSPPPPSFSENSYVVVDGKLKAVKSVSQMAPCHTIPAAFSHGKDVKTVSNLSSKSASPSPSLSILSAMNSGSNSNLSSQGDVISLPRVGSHLTHATARSSINSHHNLVDRRLAVSAAASFIQELKVLYLP